MYGECILNSMLYLYGVPTAFNYSYDGAAENFFKSCAKIQVIKQTKKKSKCNKHKKFQMLLGFNPVLLLHQPEKDSLSHRTFNCMELAAIAVC